MDWTAERAEFFVDGQLIRSCPHPAAYPMQMMIAVFDFPDQSTGTDLVPSSSSTTCATRPETASGAGSRQAG